MKQVRDCNILLSGPKICAKVEDFTEKLKIKEFEVSTDWFEGFYARYDIKFKRSDENASMDLEEANTYRKMKQL